MQSKKKNWIFIKARINLAVMMTLSLTLLTACEKSGLEKIVLPEKPKAEITKCSEVPAYVFQCENWMYEVEKYDNQYLCR